MDSIYKIWSVVNKNNLGIVTQKKKLYHSEALLFSAEESLLLENRREILRFAQNDTASYMFWYKKTTDE